MIFLAIIIFGLVVVAMSTSNTTTTPDVSGPDNSTTQQDAGEAQKTYLIMDEDGRILGPIPNYNKWSTRAGRLLRTHIPINFRSWKIVDKYFKDSLWNALMVMCKLS